MTELWNPRGGAYNVDTVLCVMVRGLEDELQARKNGELGGMSNFGEEMYASDYSYESDSYND